MHTYRTTDTEGSNDLEYYILFSLQIQGQALNNEYEDDRANGPPAYGDSVTIQMETRDGLSSFLLQVSGDGETDNNISSKYVSMYACILQITYAHMTYKAEITRNSPNFLLSPLLK